MLGLIETSVVTIVVAAMAFAGTLVASTFGFLAQRSSRAAAREVNTKDGDDDRTLAERIDARFDRLESRIDRLEGRIDD